MTGEQLRKDEVKRPFQSRHDRRFTEDINSRGIRLVITGGMVVTVPSQKHKVKPVLGKRKVTDIRNRDQRKTLIVDTIEKRK